MRGLLVIAAVGLASCATGPAETPAPVQGSLAPEQVVAARQAAFQLSAATFGSIKSAMDAGAEPKTQTFAARGLVRWANTLPSMFPEGSRVGNTRAKPEIWSNRADFEAKAAAYAAAATRLAELSQAGDKAAFTAQWAALRETCNACHTPYRAEPPR